MSRPLIALVGLFTLIAVVTWALVIVSIMEPRDECNRFPRATIFNVPAVEEISL